MNSERFIEIQAAIYEVGLLFNQAPSDEKINAYAKALSNYSPKQIVFAFNKVIKSGSAFFPSLAEILKHLQASKETKEDVAPIVVNEIINFIRMHSPHLESNYFHELSPMALATIRFNGGTKSIRDSQDDGTMRAQLRDLVKGSIARSESIEKNNALSEIGIIESGKILEFSNMKKLNMEGF